MVAAPAHDQFQATAVEEKWESCAVAQDQEREMHKDTETHVTVGGQRVVMEKMEKHFHDTQSMVRMMLSLSKRIRSLEDTQPLGREGLNSESGDPIRPSSASKHPRAHGKLVSKTAPSLTNPIL